MRKFKLIKEYIGSPKLGTTANYTGDLFDKDNDLLPSVVKDKHFFEFWEEIIEKKLLFTTEDGIDIFEEGVKVFTVDRDFNFAIDKIKICKPFDKNYPLKHWYKGTKIFSSQEASDNYILMNKPCLSIAEVVNFKGSRDSNFLEMDLKELVKSKL